MPKLKITLANTIEFREVQDLLTIGKDPKQDITVKGERVSESHCQIIREGKTYKLIDLMSRHGTYVNGVPVRECTLRNGDSIVVGDAMLTFQEETQTDSTTRRIKRNVGLEYLERDIMTVLLKINGPIELGKGGFQNYGIFPLEELCSWLGAIGIGIFLYEQQRHRLINQAGLDHILNPLRLLVFEPLLAKIKAMTNIQQITDLNKYGINLVNSPCAEVDKIIAVPIMALTTEIVAHFAIEQRSQGMLLVLYDRKKKKFNSGEITFLEAMAHQMATCFCNRSLFLRASSDLLTRLYNRGFLERTFIEELRIASEHGEFLSVALLDIDYLGEYNEGYNLEQSDNLLQEAARIIMENLSANDVAARYGGQKFVVLLPRQSAIRAYNWAENVRKAINQHFSEECNISMSIGIASFPDNATSTDVLLKRSDQALYRAKLEGGNKTVYYDETIDLAGPRTDTLAGLVSGDSAKDYGNVQRLVETVNIMSSYTDFERLVEELVDKVLDITHAQRAIILLGENPDDLKVHFGRNIFKQRITKIERYSTTIPKKVMEKGEPICVLDEVESQQDTSLSMAQFELRTVMCAPLHNKEQKPFGVLYVDTQVQQKKYEISDLIFFETICKQIALALENARLHKMASEQERLQQEITLASQIQQRFLPQQMPELDNFAIYGHTWPALEVGGDYYDIIPAEGNHVYLCIGDVSGKGLGSGLIMVMARTALHTIVKGNTLTHCSDILFHINNLIYENTDKEFFMSMLLMDIDLNTNIINYSSAGHEHILVYRTQTRICEKIVSGGLVLGIRKNQKYQQETLEMRQGDKVALYTDGATEALNTNKKQFGLDALVKLVEQFYTLSPQEMCHALFQQLQNFMGKQPQYDDITLLILEKIKNWP